MGKTIEQAAMELCGKVGLAGSAWAKDGAWLSVYDAIQSARAEALEEAAILCQSLCCGDATNCPEATCEYRQCAEKIRALAKEEGK